MQFDWAKARLGTTVLPVEETVPLLGKVLQHTFRRQLESSSNELWNVSALSVRTQGSPVD
jgi:hypothetical protein